jgi:hypothetical protein
MNLVLAGGAKGRYVFDRRRQDPKAVTGYESVAILADELCCKVDSPKTQTLSKKEIEFQLKLNPLPMKMMKPRQKHIRVA